MRWASGGLAIAAGASAEVGSLRQRSENQSQKLQSHLDFDFVLVTTPTDHELGTDTRFLRSGSHPRVRGVPGSLVHPGTGYTWNPGPLGTRVHKIGLYWVVLMTIF